MSSPLAERRRFVWKCARRGLKALQSVWGVVAFIFGVSAAVGLAVSNKVLATGPTWVKVAVLAAIILLVLIEGAFCEVENVTATPRPGAAVGASSPGVTATATATPSQVPGGVPIMTVSLALAGQPPMQDDDTDDAPAGVAETDTETGE